jgi:hypothetical protein
MDGTSSITFHYLTGQARQAELFLAEIVVLGASPVPINWDQIKEFAQDVQELRQDSLKYGQ